MRRESRPTGKGERTMDNLEDYLAFHHHETRGWGWLSEPEAVFCCNCDQQIHPDEVGAYTLVETGEPVCGEC